MPTTPGPSWDPKWMLPAHVSEVEDLFYDLFEGAGASDRSQDLSRKITAHLSAQWLRLWSASLSSQTSITTVVYSDLTLRFPELFSVEANTDGYLSVLNCVGKTLVVFGKPKVGVLIPSVSVRSSKVFNDGTDDWLRHSSVVTYSPSWSAVFTLGSHEVSDWTRAAVDVSVDGGATRTITELRSVDLVDDQALYVPASDDQLIRFEHFNSPWGAIWNGASSYKVPEPFFPILNQFAHLGAS